MGAARPILRTQSELTNLLLQALTHHPDGLGRPRDVAVVGPQGAQQEAALEQQKQAILRQILSEKAKQRLANIKLVKPAVASSIEDQLIYLAQSGRIRGVISEEQLLQILKQLQGQKRDSKIRFERR